MTKDRLADTPLLWVEWARRNPIEWASYDGGCECPSCRRYRRRFKAWHKELRDADDAARAAAAAELAELREENKRLRAGVWVGEGTVRIGSTASAAGGET